MAIKNNKRGYAFSFFSLFLVILIFYYAELRFDKDTFSSANNLEEFRIYSMNQEMLYFKDSYFLEVFDIASYKAMDLLINESTNQNVYNLYKDNYSMLNSLLKELLLNASINSTFIPAMELYTLPNLTNSYIENTKKNYFLNTSYDIKKLVIYERDPMVLDIQIEVEFEFVSQDKVSSWNFNETLMTKFQAYNLRDPSYYIVAGLGEDSPRINPVELYAANLNWDLDLFNITLENQFTTIYYDSNYKYTIGTSLLKNLFNVSQGSYKDIFMFYSFDYDQEEGEIYDSSQSNHTSIFYGDSLVLLDFQNHTSIKDLSSYNHTIITPIGIQNSSICPWESCIYLNASNSQYLRINDNEFTSLDKFSTSLWFNIENSTSTQTLLASGISGVDPDFFEISFLENLTGLNITLSCDSIIHSFITEFEDFFPDTWNNLYMDFNSNTGRINVFLNGVLENTYSFDSTTCSTLTFDQDILIGTNAQASSSFTNGFLDEMGIYSEIFSEDQIGESYFSGQIYEVDYMDSLYDKGLFINGGNYINISLESLWEDFHQNNFSIGLWFLPTTSNATLLTYDTELSIGYNKTGIFISDNNGNTAFFDDLLVIENRYNYLVLRKNNLGSEVFLNNKQASSASFIVGGPLSPNYNQGDFIVGSATMPSNGVVANDFEGIIDEIVFYNRSLTNFEIERQYYNFDSEAKGCCNYLTLFNPHIYGHNTSTYKVNTSYSSHMYFNTVFRGIDNNITLYSVKNITSSSTPNKYYNFLVDNCMARAYNIYGFFNDGSALGSPPHRYGDDELLSCSWLIGEGYY